ncbi:MAG TPA: hypothetical protein VK742_15120 [Candidatus Sulfotelmatobacter sp.]|jgi:Flp pilus assembly protein TadD|nr:hypothetical protein [Candidatus Sulfotelmatobacter sp.]
MNEYDLSQDKNEQESLEALFASIDEGPDAGLKRLEGKTDPYSIRRKLIILMNAQRYREAADIVRDHMINEEWAEQGIQALMLNDDLVEAEKFFESTQKLKSRIKCDKCRFTFAYALTDIALVRVPSAQSSLFMIDEAQKVKLNRAEQILTPLLATIKRPENDFEEKVLGLAYKLSILNQKKNESRQLMARLFSRTPVPLILGEMFLGQLTNEMPVGLTDRLITDHPKSFDAKFMAALILGLYEKNLSKAFEIARSLISEAKDSEHKQKVAQLLDALSDNLDKVSKEFALQKINDLLAGNEFELALRNARTSIENNQLVVAREILEKVRDEKNVRWLQILADLETQSSQPEKAFEVLKQIAILHPHPVASHRAAQAAFNLDKFEDAIQLLQSQLSIDACNVRSRSLLASVYVKMGEFVKAAEQYGRLKELEPGEHLHALNQAISLQSAGETDSSLSVYESLSKAPLAPIQAFLGMALLLKSKNEADKGFQILESIKTQHWDDPRFVGTFMDLAHASQADVEAHNALLRLQELQQTGKIEGAIKAVSFDEIVDHMQQFAKRKEEILNFSIRGQFPWLMAEELFGRVPYWGWTLRTEELNWLPEDALVRAEHSIYSTNYFFVSREKDGKGSVKEIACSPKNKPVVIDLSALITVHRLGLLEKTAEYFGRVLIPADYSTRIMEENSRLVLHQKSQKSSASAIKSLLDRNKIKVATDFNQETMPPMPYLNEYPLDTETFHSYKIQDVLDLFLSNGQISAAKYNEARRVAHRPSSADAAHPALKPAQLILTALSTLKTLHGIELLETLTSICDVHISQADRDTVVGEVRGFEMLETVYRWHNELWALIRADKRFVHLRYNSVKSPFSVGKNENEMPLSAYLLSTQQQVPLFADDRTCQTIAINERPGFEYASFGTDRLLNSLAAEGLITIEKLSAAYLQLIKWRYRFLVPPKQVLTHLALEFLSNFPGKPLREIARYAHDSMRDAGLLAGFEATEPPTSIANRLFLEWETVIVQFLMELWKDGSIPDDKLEGLTRWAIREFLPSPPRSSGPAISEVLTSLQSKTVLSHALIFSLNMKNQPKANRVIRLISSELGITDENYSKIITEVINEV